MAKYQFPAADKITFESNGLWTAFETTNGPASYGFIDAQGNGQIDDFTINNLIAAGVPLDTIAVNAFAAANHAAYIAPYVTGFVETDVVKKPAGDATLLPRDLDYWIVVEGNADNQTLTVLDTANATVGDTMRVMNKGTHRLTFVASGGDAIVGQEFMLPNSSVVLKMTSVDEWTAFGEAEILNASDFVPTKFYEKGALIRFSDELYIRNSSGTALSTFQEDRFFWSRAYNAIDAWIAVRAASFADVDIANDLENGDVLDGVTLATGDRVLLAGQDVASQNGIYRVQATGTAFRTTDADGSADFAAGKIVYVQEGTSNEGKHVKQTTTGAVTVGATSIAFKTVLTPGAGLEKQGTVTADADVGEGIYNLDASAGAFDHTLPAATGSQERRLFVGEDVETNNATIRVQAGERLNGAADATFTASTNGQMILAIDRATGDWDLTVLGAAQMTTLNRLQAGLGSTRNDALATHYLFANNLFSQGSDLSLSGTGSIQGLQAGKTYKLTFSGALDGPSGSGNAAFRFVDLTADAQIGEAWELISQGSNVPEGTQSAQIAFFTPTVTTEVGVDFLTGTVGELGALATFTVEELPTTEAVLAGMVTPEALTYGALRTEFGGFTGVDTQIIYPTTDSNVGGAFAASVFTAPVAADYEVTITGNVDLNEADNSTRNIYVTKNEPTPADDATALAASVLTAVVNTGPNEFGAHSYSSTTIMSLFAGDTLSTYFKANSGTDQVQNATFVVKQLPISTVVSPDGLTPQTLHRAKYHLATGTATGAGNTDLLMDTIDFNVGGIAAAGIVTIVQNGTYLIHARAGNVIASNNSQTYIKVNGTTVARARNSQASGGNLDTQGVVSTHELVAGDTVQMGVYTNGVETTPTGAEDRPTLEVIQLADSTVVTIGDLEVTNPNEAGTTKTLQPNGDGTATFRDSTFTQNQLAFSSQTLLTVNHNFGRYVIPFVVLPDGTQIGDDAMNVNQTLNTLTITFNVSESGTLIYI